jgi:hypothetical protein
MSVGGSKSESRAPQHYGTVVHLPERNGWGVKVNHPEAMTPLSRSVHEELGRRVFWTKEQAEAALYAIYAGDPRDF